jgi:hypothetical protein
MESFPNWITSTQSLKILKVSGCVDFITPVGWQAFATALASLDNIEEIDIQNIGYYNTGVNSMLLLDVIIAKQTLKRVPLALATIAQIQTIANTLGSPNCNITELDNDCRNPERTNPTALERERLAQICINSLQRNSPLEI